MPEGPEVRFFADELAHALKGKRILLISARTKKAREWLERHPLQLEGKTLVDVFAYGKNLIGLIEGNYFFYSHQMMWGRWMIVDGILPPPVDRRERARIVVENTTAILMSAPVFEIGEGDPFEKISYLQELGPNALTYPGQTFDGKEFLARLGKSENALRSIGSALLDQTIVAGLGNYLRAEILFEAKMDPWRTVASLTDKELQLLHKLVPDMTARAYTAKATVTDELRDRMRGDETLVYVAGKDYGTRHYVFRRTNLPCLICGNPIKQLRQETGPIKSEVPENAPGLEDDEEEKTRIIYFCANCQDVKVPPKSKPQARSKKLSGPARPLIAKAKSASKSKPTAAKTTTRSSKAPLTRIDEKPITTTIKQKPTTAKQKRTAVKPKRTKVTPVSETARTKSAVAEPKLVKARSTTAKTQTKSKSLGQTKP